MFLQEIQDNDGVTLGTATVDANVTLTTLISAIHAAGSTAKYDFTEVIPLNGTTGGEGGGNIRNAHL